MIKNTYFRFCLLMLTECGIASDRGAEIELKRQYDIHYLQPSDINEHLPRLRELAKESSSVIEIGLRSMVSSWSVLLGLSENSSDMRSYLGIDLHSPPIDSLNLAQSLAEAKGISFRFWEKNDMQVDIEPADMLFIDSLHTYCHLTYELEKFSPKIRKYIALHDTSAPWGDTDDSCYWGDYSEYPSHIDRNKRGLWPAVVDFLRTHPEWSLLERRLNNHGFTVLARNSAIESKIDYALKNNIILCTGPSLKRKEMLKENTEKDIELIPFKKVFLSSNDPLNGDLLFAGEKPVWQLLEERGKQLDCLNCIITTIKNVVGGPTCTDDDIILFKHESLYINDMSLFRKAVGKILSGHDMVIRFWAPGGFYMTDAFLLKVSSARKLFKNIEQVPAFVEYGFCEDYFTKLIVNALPNVYGISYSHFTRKDTELGLFHIPIPGEENWEGYWDKRNYDEIYSLP